MINVQCLLMYMSLLVDDSSAWSITTAVRMFVLRLAVWKIFNLGFVFCRIVIWYDTILCI